MRAEREIGGDRRAQHQELGEAEVAAHEGAVPRPEARRMRTAEVGVAR